MTKTNKTRSVPTTILTIEREAINWGKLRQSCHIVRYKMPFYNRKTDKHYFARMHNWYKQESDYPCYLHTYGPYLYVKYGSPNEAIILSYEGYKLFPEAINLESEDMLPWIMKLLTTDFFRLDGRFVSNAKFFLWSLADKDFVTGLGIDIKHNWRNNKDEFIISDEATRLRKLRSVDFDNIQTWRQVYYGRFYPTLDMPIFKQLKKNQLTRKQLREGIYELYEGSRINRASLTFHSTKSLHALQQTRSYLLNQFITQFVAYLNRLGLPFQQKRLPMQPVHIKPTSTMQHRQLPLEQKPIYIIDDRLNATRRLDDFVIRFCEVVNASIPDHASLFAIKPEAELKPQDWVLRIQDYEKDDFDVDKGILKDHLDPKTDFYTRHPYVVKQTINVNGNSRERQKETQRQKLRTWSKEEYLKYDMPTVADIKTQLQVCRNQLLLKDAVMFPHNVLLRFPQIEMMAGMIFIYKQALAYFDGQNLHFMAITNNFEEACAFVQAHTGWDLLEDVSVPSSSKWDPFNSQKDEALKRHFILSRDFVWEIWENEAGRVLNEDMIIKKRLEELEQSRPINQFYSTELDASSFSRQQLQAYVEFLDSKVPQATISYTDLKTKYGKHIKDGRGAVVENGGFFNLLGIRNSQKYREYLKEFVGLPLESVREDHLFPVYKGIWYAPDTNHYVAGVKDSNKEEQERGHTLRQIVVHQGAQEQNELMNQLMGKFFPLLEVNFIRHLNYTVVPFPFRLIEIWLETVKHS